MRLSTKRYNYDYLDFKVVTEDQFAGHQGPDLFDTEKTKPKLVFELFLFYRLTNYKTVFFFFFC